MLLRLEEHRSQSSGVWRSHMAGQRCIEPYNAPMPPRPDDERWLRHSFDLALNARSHGGDQPFAAVLVDESSKHLLEAVNTRGADLTGHAETTVMRAAVARWPSELIRRCTLFSSTEPCLMCAGAIAWAGPRTLVYGLSQRRMNDLPWDTPPRFRDPIAVETLLAGLATPIEIRGPLLEDEALAVHVAFLEREARHR